MEQYVDVPKLDKDGNELINIAGDVKKTISSLATVVDALQGNWQDEAYTKFKAQFESKRESLLKIATTLNTYGESAVEQAATYGREAPIL